MSIPKVSIRKTSEGSVHLDALRGAAALLVFANHTRALYFSSVLQRPRSTHTLATQGSPIENPAGPAAVGGIKFASEAVVIFFVLSGYLVGGSVLRLLQTAQWSWRVYLTKRITRLWIVLLPAILIGVALDYTGNRIFGAGSVYTAPAGLDLVTTADLVHRFRPTVLLGNAFFLESIWVPFPGTNASIWSLVNEFWYYIAFPLAALAWTTKKGWLQRLAWGLGACAILIFVGWPITVLFPLWLFGALISALPKRLSLKQAKQLSWVFGIVLLIGMFGVRLLPLRAIQAEYIVGLLTSLLLWAVVQQTSPAKGGLYKTVAGFFSRISYTLYLFHLPMAMFLCGFLNSPWHPWAYTPKNVAMYLVSDVLIVVLVYGIWRVFEANTDLIREKVFERERRMS